MEVVRHHTPPEQLHAAEDRHTLKEIAKTAAPFFVRRYF